MFEHNTFNFLVIGINILTFALCQSLEYVSVSICVSQISITLTKGNLFIKKKRFISTHSFEVLVHDWFTISLGSTLWNLCVYGRAKLVLSGHERQGKENVSPVI